MNTDIICRWRDAITDPPMSDWAGHIKVNGIKMIGRIVNGVVYTFGPNTSRAFTAVPGDQWLDVTAIPAVAVAKVQAAVKRIKDCQEMSRGNNEYVAFGTAVDVIEEYTGITPSEVQP